MAPLRDAFVQYISRTSYVSLCADIACACLTVYILSALSTSNNRLYPPGPPGWPIVGNAFQLPINKHWLLFDKWTQDYGDIFCISSLGETTIILGSVKAAIDLLDVRGNIYSDRPPATMAGDLVGWNLGLGYARFDPASPQPPSSKSLFPVSSNARFRELRRIFRVSIGPRACKIPDLVIMQGEERARLLGRLLAITKKDENGLDIGHVIRESTGSLILLLTYGYRVTSAHDPLVKIVEDAMLGFARASEPGAFWVDRWPILKYIPAWLPFADFRRKAKLMREDREKLYDQPFDYVKSQLRENRALASIVSAFMTSDEDDHGGKEESKIQADEELVKAAAASLYSGGAETTQSSLMSFLLAMLIYPDVLAKAQAEIDAYLGPARESYTCRMPAIEDIQELPYISALVKEVWRWNPSVPLGLAHRLTEDDTYRGYHIKKGSTVYANIWSILHDPETYPVPFEFRPERFLDEGGQLKKLEKYEDPGWIAFGFGRRICPGMFLAENSISLIIASLLYVFNIEKATDADGMALKPEVDYDGFICHPKPFRCRISPKSRSAEALILRELPVPSEDLILK